MLDVLSAADILRLAAYRQDNQSFRANRTLQNLEKQGAMVKSWLSFVQSLDDPAEYSRVAE